MGGVITVICRVLRVHPCGQRNEGPCPQRRDGAEDRLKGVTHHIQFPALEDTINVLSKGKQEFEKSTNLLGEIPMI